MYQQYLKEYDIMDKIVRVAVNNNFNCTVAEYKQLDDLKMIHPESIFFVNSNIKTPKLLAINMHPYRAVITLNPDITIDSRLVQRLYDIDSSKVSFARIKYIPNHPEIVDLIYKVSETCPVVITLQRFNSKKSIADYIPDYPEHYKWSFNRFRLFGDSLAMVEKIAQPKNNIYICDRHNLGCGGCGLCSKLTTGRSLPIYTLNLSSSGLCQYHCPDCYAKTMQHFLREMGKPVIQYDHIHMNSKQAGRTKHIKHART
jgi:hypothetical protein